jgi:glutathione S-transferase
MSNQITTKPKNQHVPVILWGVSLSPFVRKVMVALEEKGIAYEQREILPKSLLQATHQAVPVDFDRAIWI